MEQQQISISFGVSFDVDGEPTDLELNDLAKKIILAADPIIHEFCGNKKSKVELKIVKDEGE